jgi:hypothetical protein
MADKVTKLHEILAVEGDRAKAAQKVLTEARHVFSSKHNLFTGAHRRLEMFSEERKQEEASAEVMQRVTETVPSKLAYITKALATYWDLVLLKEATNQRAEAELIIGDVVLGKLPATWLLGMESKLGQLRDVLDVVPTWPAGHDWQADTSMGTHIYKAADPKRSRREEKTMESKVLYDATKEHPAQIEKWMANHVVGMYTDTAWTGTVSPAVKSEMLERCDKVLRAVKKARQRANRTDVVKNKVSKRLIGYIFTGEL